MHYQVKLLRGLVAPYVSSHQLRKAEQFHGIWKRTILLILLSIIISGIGAFYGIGNESLSKLIYETTASEFESIKGLFGVGQVIQDMLATILMIFFPSLVFWVFSDIEYRKLVVIQLLVTTIFLIEKAILTPFQFYFGIGNTSSPFSLGVIAQYITNYDFIIHFLSTISLFSIWSMALQYYYLKITTDKSRNLLLLLIFSINLFIWIFTALFSYIKFDVFL